MSETEIINTSQRVDLREILQLFGERVESIDIQISDGKKATRQIVHLRQNREDAEHVCVGSGRGRAE